MKIKDYRLFLESKTDIDSICKKYDIKNYTINEDGTVDVNGSVSLCRIGLTKLPLRFGKVTGYFDCSSNQLTSLEGSPYYVGGYFSCKYNRLTSLESCSKFVLYDFYCGNNQLTSLEGCPKTIYSHAVFFCENNNLVDFKGFPEDFDGYVNFTNNPVNELLRNIPKDIHSKFIYWCNEYDAIDKGISIPERIEEVYNKLGLKYEEN